MTVVFLKKGRDHSVRNRHPWIFSGAIDRLEGEAAPGDIVLVRDAAGEALGFGAYSPASQIRIRMLTFDPKDVDDSGKIKISNTYTPNNITEQYEVHAFTQNYKVKVTIL